MNTDRQPSTRSSQLENHPKLLTIRQQHRRALSLRAEYVAELEKWIANGGDDSALSRAEMAYFQAMDLLVVSMEVVDEIIEISE